MAAPLRGHFFLPLALAFAACPRACGADAAAEDGTCAADGSCAPAAAAAVQAQAYYWPQQKGDVNRTGLSPYKAPFPLSAPTWSFLDPHDDVARSTPLIDDKRNIYHSTNHGRIYKFSPDGKMLWQFHIGTALPAVPALMDGSLFYNTKDGTVVALDMERGTVRWREKISASTGGDTACVYAVDGLVISATEMGEKEVQGMGSNNAVVALRASDGSRVWTFKHKWVTFNFQASSPGDGTMVFQDRAGGVYRLNLTNGEKVWESGVLDRSEGDFTTGATVVGPNGVVYAASNYRGRGIIHAYRLEDGKPVWRRTFDMEVNQAVAVGKLAGSDLLSVVAGIGNNPMLPAACWAIPILLALDALATFAFCCACCCTACNGKQFRFCRRLALLLLMMVLQVPVLYGYHQLSLALEAQPGWLFFVAPLKANLVALDAETGKTRWSYEPPAFKKPATENDEVRLLPRLYKAAVLKEEGDPICLPDNWAQTVVDAAGTTYGGHQDGYLYAVRDADGDGLIDATKEVSRHYMGAGFQASQAIAPGMFAAVPCGGGLFVWSY